MAIKSPLKLKSMIIAGLVRAFVVTMLVVLSTTLCLATTALKTAASHIVFLNPGEPVDRGKGMFWPMTARLMAVAAKTFGMELEVLYAGSDAALVSRTAVYAIRTYGGVGILLPTSLTIKS